MLDSTFFLLCIFAIICATIVCITFIAYKRHSNNIEDNIEVSERYYPDDFISLGNYYINTSYIKSIYLSNENYTVTIYMEDTSYFWDFEEEDKYYNYIDYLNQNINIL